MPAHRGDRCGLNQKWVRRCSSHSFLTGRPHESQKYRCHSLVMQTIAKQLRGSEVRRLSNRRSRRWIMATALMCAVIGLSAACGTPLATATSPSTPAIGSGSGGLGSNARSGPASGGALGTVATVSTSGFTMSISTGQKVTVNEASSTTYQNGTGPTSASAIATGVDVLVLGTTNGTTIAAVKVIVQPAGGRGSTASSAGVVPFQPGAPTTSKQVGQIPAHYSSCAGTVLSR